MPLVHADKLAKLLLQEASITTILLNKAVDMMRHKGIPALEEAVMSQVGKNKTKNAKVLKDFFEELCVRFRLFLFASC